MWEEKGNFCDATYSTTGISIFGNGWIATEKKYFLTVHLWILIMGSCKSLINIKMEL